MKTRDVFTFALALSCGVLAVVSTATAAETEGKTLLRPFADARPIVYAPARGVIVPKASNLIFHGGPVIVSAKVVFIFWGPSFADATSADHTYATTLQAYRNQFGTTREYNVITQYSGIQLTNLGSGTADWFDTSTPPVKVTDAKVQAEVNAYLASHGGNNPSTIYEVVIPSTSYSDDGTGLTSCGGPNLAYCAYHNWIGSGASAIKYSIQPYPSCSGCQVSGWSTALDQELFVCHNTRNAVTDPTGTGWWDTSGAEVDSKCNGFSFPPFLDAGNAYGWAWSNLVSACVKWR